MLSPDEIDAYHRDGYIIPRWRFSPEDLGRMLDAVERVIASNPDHRPEQLVCPHARPCGTEIGRAGVCWQLV